MTPPPGTLLTASSSSTDGTSYATASITPGANRLVVATIFVGSASSVPDLTVTGCGLTWELMTSTATATRRLLQYRALGAAPTAGAVTFSAGAVTLTSAVWSVVEYAGVDTSGTNGSGAVVAANAFSARPANGTSVSQAWPTAPTAGNSVQAAIGIGATNEAQTEGSGWTKLAGNGIGSPANSMMTEWASTPPAAIAGSWTSASPIYVIGLEIKPAPVTPKAATLVDDFATKDTGKWTWGGAADVSGGKAVFPVNASYADSITSNTLYDLTSSSFVVRLDQVPNVGNGTTELQVQMAAGGAANKLFFNINGGFLAAYRTVAGTNTSFGTAPALNLTSQRYLRFRHDGTQVHAEYSADAVTWSEIGAGWTPTIDCTAMNAVVLTGFYGTEPSPGTAQIESVNVAAVTQRLRLAAALIAKLYLGSLPLPKVYLGTALVLGTGGDGGANPPLRTWDYQTGDLSQWVEAFGAAPVIVTDQPHRSMTYAAKFTAVGGEHATFDEGVVPAVDRTEVSDYVTAHIGDVQPGTEQWWAFSVKFPANLVAPTSWCGFLDFHHTGSTGSTPFSFRITPGSNPPRMQAYVRGGDQATAVEQTYDLGECPLDGTWVDFRFYVLWSDTAAGRLVIKKNTAADGSGWATVADITQANLFTGFTVYVQEGVYRNTVARTEVWYHTGLRRGASEASVTY